MYFLFFGLVLTKVIKYRENEYILMDFYHVLAMHVKNRSMFLESLFSTVLIWSYYETFCSNVTPRNFIHSCLLIMLSPFLKSEISEGMLSLRNRV